MGHGVDYEYSQNSESGVVEQDYLGVERSFYRPVSRGFESELAERLKLIKKQLRGIS